MLWISHNVASAIVGVIDLAIRVEWSWRRVPSGNWLSRLRNNSGLSGMLVPSSWAGALPVQVQGWRACCSVCQVDALLQTGTADKVCRKVMTCQVASAAELHE